MEQKLREKNKSKKSISGRIGTILIVVGVVAVLAAAALFIWNRVRDVRAAREAAGALEDIIGQLPEGSEVADGSEGASVGDSDDILLKWYNEDRPMTVKNVNGSAYIGYISIPDIDRNLPVLSEWSYAGLNISPCRYNGTTYARNLVICAHNYESHFGLIKNLTAGSQVTFTDMDGVKWLYEVIYVGTYQPTDVELMISGEYDLTLFTCTYSGQARVTVGCILKAVNA